ncbi:transglutaminase family protein [Sneathiella sp.]|uniref:transglutaminase-like domain-containing protein n=1 Tax=Sneathiella sp. TaxID=1964365 RepID=UPI0026383B59|nr:transglutaminase family protein [Sneathiella sp.]MDF2366713.1 transglutaminase family protein [Sneathiella sp.]
MKAQDNQVPPEAEKFLQSAEFVDSNSREVQDFTARALGGLAVTASDTEKTIRLFEAVRDGLKYDPYRVSLEPNAYRASTIAKGAAGYCVPKAILLTACLRAAGVPAALGFADVRNHLNTPKLTELMGTDLFIYHGYVQVWLEGESYKITPAFNMELCERFGVKPLVFDGTSDALFHEFNEQDEQHMEYVNDRGLFLDVPIDGFLRDFRAAYPNMVAHIERGESPNTKDAFTIEEQ